MIRKVFFSRSFFAMLAMLMSLGITALAQADTRARERQIVTQSSDQMWYTMGFLVFVGFSLAGWLWWKSKKGGEKVEYNHKNRYANYHSQQAIPSADVDADKELEGLRKLKSTPRRQVKISPPTNREARSDNDTGDDPAAFQTKMRRLQYSQLPINSFTKLAPAKRYTPLRDSDDEALLSAIEQANDEFEEDETIRELSLKVLAAFKNQNAVDALSQMALYDLSANLRSRAVAALAEFDDECVFEPILLACADPTREVRAAAARGLFNLSFDRAHAWKRLIEANDTFRLTQSARAAIESGIVERSFERLIHEDSKVAYEAFALVSLLIKAGETNEIFEAIESHKDERVRFALLHVLKVQRDERTIDGLTRLALSMSRKPEMLERLKETIADIQKSVHHEAWQVRIT